MKSSKRTRWFYWRERRGPNYYIIKPYLQQKTFLILTQLWRNSILHCENENLIKDDWLTRYVGIRNVPPNISLAESDSDRYGNRFLILVIV
jgi:hypothetical protein